MCVQWAGNNLPQGDFDKGHYDKNGTIARVCIFYGTACFTVGWRVGSIEVVTDDNYNEV